MRTKKMNKGFTLVEVIVVAVIVAVLALVGIQLYQGYVTDARQNTAENLAASAAGYLATERNRGSTIAAQTVTGAAAGVDIAVTAGGGMTATHFTVPNNTILTITGTQATGGTVTAKVGAGSNQVTSDSYKW